jgi:multidrug efflux pump subunit AcrA (membrane-fusion protein)
MTFVRIALLAALAAFAPLAGCSKKHQDPPAGGAETREAAAGPTNRVDIPAPVRQNLGITFAKVERRPVATTIRVPGRFELLPEARREYRTMIEGKVELKVRQFDRVEPSTVLYLLESPRWRELQQSISAADSEILLARASSETMEPLRNAHHAHEEALFEAVQLWKERVEQLQKLREAGGGKAEEISQARATLTTTQAERADVMEKAAELEARARQTAAELDAAKAKFDILIATAASLLGIGVDELKGPSSSDPNAPPRWRTLATIEVRASAAGVVEALTVTNGAWVAPSSLVVSTIQPDRLRFVAHALQSDLTRLKDNLPASIVPPRRAAANPEEAMRGKLMLGLSARPDERTLDLYTTPDRLAPWARPGVSAYLEVTLEGGTDDLAIPLAAVARDGLKSIVFRRDPRNPDKAIRLEGDLGVDDGRWIVIKSGIAEGDEVVVDGMYQLMLATSGSAPKGGHFHADGTFHEGDHK